MNYLLLLALMMGCDDGQAPVAKNKKPNKESKAKEAPKAKKLEAPKPVQESLVGGPYPGLLVSQVWFWTDDNIK